MNLRVGRLELDVVAREGPVIAVVEVRTRGPGAWVRALDSVDAKKRARVRRAGERLWRERFARDPPRRADALRRGRRGAPRGRGGRRGEDRIVKAAF